MLLLIAHAPRYALAQDVEYAVVDPISPVPILPDTPLSVTATNRTIVIEASPGEFEPASFVLRLSDGADPARVEFDLSDLSFEQNVLSARNLDLKVVKVWYQAHNAWTDWRHRRKKTPVLVPELLLHDEELVRVDRVNKRNYLRLSDGAGTRYVDISVPSSDKKAKHHPIDQFDVRDAPRLMPIRLSPSETKQLWLTVHIPDGTSPGRYEGGIDVIVDGRRALNIPIELTIHPIRLAKPEIVYSIFYRSKIDPEHASIGSDWKTERQFRAEMTDLVNHGVTSPNVYGNIDQLRSALRLRAELGVEPQPVFFTGFNTKDYTAPGRGKKMRERVDQLLSLRQEFGTGPIYVFGQDEAKGAALSAQFDAWSTVRSLGAGVFITGDPDLADTVAGKVDVFVLNGVKAYDSHAPLPSGPANRMHDAGGKIYAYSYPQAGPENPFIFRKNYGLALWQSGYDGAMTYAYMTSMVSVWNDFDHWWYRDHNLVYPTADGVIDTIAWEGFREAVDDVRYINTLENTIKARPAAQARDANEFLRQLRRHKPDCDGPPANLPSSCTDLNGMRSKLMRFILENSK